VIEVYGVFEGGGVRGTALVGAVAAAEKEGIGFRAVAGTSAGAIVASLIAAGYKAEEMRALLTETDFKKFMDPVSRVPLWKRYVAWRRLGLYEGDEFHRWIAEKISISGIPSASGRRAGAEDSLAMGIDQSSDRHRHPSQHPTANRPRRRSARD
jgi:NTE family protein